MSIDNLLLEEALGGIPTERFAPEIVNIFRYISNHEKVIFLSQQIDDPDLCPIEKYLLAERCFMRNRLNFLLRFGRFLKEEHLHAFAQHAICEGSAPRVGAHESVEEMQLILKDLHKKLQQKQKTVRNRRYTYMQQMIKDGHDYFSEQEMMCREPELYQELVGQYLSEADREERDKYDVRNTSISNIMLHHFTTKENHKILQQAQEKNIKEQIAETTAENVKKDEEEEKEVTSYGKHWGSFDDEEEAACTSKKSKLSEKPLAKSLRENKMRNALITAAERQLLRQEFFSIMQEQFLNGKDADFDYSKVDEDCELDDLEQIANDEEDAYFAESDSDSSDTYLNELELSS